MDSVPGIRLRDGNVIPQLGLGVWQVEPSDTARVVRDALRVGYRAIDTAEGYHNEAGVGEGIRNSGVAREQIFVTSKLRNGAHDRDSARKAFDLTMRELGLDQLDLFLIHWPVPGQDKYVEAWKTLIELRDEGRVRSIGVSNFNRDHLDRVIGETGEVPVVNQIELHPYFQQRAARDFHAAQGIALECYSPLGSGAVLDDAVVADIASRLGKAPAQVILRWQLQQGLIVIPKTVHAERMQQNLDVFGFTLDGEDMEALAGLDDPGGGRTGSDPAIANFTF